MAITKQGSDKRETYQSIWFPLVKVSPVTRTAKDIARGRKPVSVAIRYFTDGSGAELAKAYGLDMTTSDGMREVARISKAASDAAAAMVDPTGAKQKEFIELCTKMAMEKMNGDYLTPEQCKQLGIEFTTIAIANKAIPTENEYMEAIDKLLAAEE